MGNCCGCGVGGSGPRRSDTDAGDDGVNERTRLLGDHSDGVNRRTNVDEDLQGNGTMSKARREELVNKIIQETAESLIDISTVRIASGKLAKDAPVENSSISGSQEDRKSMYREKLSAMANDSQSSLNSVNSASKSHTLPKMSRRNTQSSTTDTRTISESTLKQIKEVDIVAERISLDFDRFQGEASELIGQLPSTSNL